MEAAGNFEKQLTEKNKAEFVKKLDKLIQAFALKIQLKPGGNIMTLN